LDIQDSTTPAGRSPSLFENILDGGKGDDTINIDQYVSIYDFDVKNFLYDINLRNTIHDNLGNNTININYGVYTNDLEIASNTSVFLGDGDDNVIYNGGADANNWIPFSEHVYDLGNGTNSLSLSDVSGVANISVTSGAGDDFLDLFYGGEEGNDNPVFASFNIDTGGGDDVVDLLTLPFGSDDGGTLQGFINLGSGDNVLNLDSQLGGAFVVNAEDGDDTLNVSTGDSDLFGNSITVSDNSIDFPFAGGVIFEVFSGGGNDTVQLSGALSNRVETGLGDDTIILGSGEATVVAGGGSDRVVISKANFNSDPFAPQNTTTIEGFNLLEGDVIELVGFDLGVFSNGGFISSASDLVEMSSGGGDLSSMTQVGADLVLTFDLGAGETGEVKILDFSIPSSTTVYYRDQPEFYDLTITGTSARDGLFGSNLNEWIEGLDGSDVIKGGSGNDYISAGQGNDYYVFGNLGADIFEFGKGDGDIKIQDFANGEDFILLAGDLAFEDLEVKSFTIGGIVTTQLITEDGDRLIFHDVAPDQIDTSDFWI